ncbi:MAG: PP2C family serine/threonine-protein phosphatase [Ardenticatenaceae bacterium]
MTEQSALRTPHPAMGWRVVGASVRGAAHVRGDVPCQDAHRYRVLGDGTLVVAVADGAGSAARADEGAFLAARYMVERLGEELDEVRPESAGQWAELVRLTMAEARCALVAHAQREEASLSTFATTLTCVVADEQWLIVGQIGDGVVVAQREDGTLVAAVQPQRGEHANETRFLTSADALEQVEVHVNPAGARALAVMTDGMLNLALRRPDYSPHAPFFEPLLQFCAQATDGTEAEEQLVAFLSSERVCGRTDDDKTLVLATQDL